MSFANFGIGLGAFTQGLAGGMQMGEQMRGIKDRTDIKKQAKKGIADATSARDADVSGRIEKTGLDNRSDFMGDVTTGYKVGDQSFGSEKEARGQAEKGVGGVMDYFMKDAAPKIAETYMAQGNPEKAEAWNTFIQDRQTQKGMEHWAGAMRAAQMGDMDGFATSLEEAYNTPGYMDDGVTVKGHKIGEDGSIAMTFERDGKEFVQTFQGTDDLIQAGIGLLSPKAAFEMHQMQSQAAAEARAEAGIEDRKFQQDLTRDTHKQNLKDESAIKMEGRQQDQAIGTLRKWGFNQEEIRELIPRILGVSNTRAGISDVDLRSKVMETLATSDRRWRTMSTEERKGLIDETVEIVRGIEEEQGGRPERGGLGSDQMSGGVNMGWP